jgi:hypothetical protein
VVLCWIPVSVLDGYGDVVLLTMLRERERGGRATVRGGMRAANGRIRTIGGWAGISVLGLVSLGLLRLVPGARLLRWTGSLAWELATFFVMPVIAFEDRPTAGTVRRSSELIRHQAKRAIAPAAGMAVACLPVFVPGLVLMYLAYLEPAFSQSAGAVAGFPPPDPTLLTLGMIALVPGATLVGTSTLLLRYALYQREGGNQAPAEFWAGDLEAAMPSPVAAAETPAGPGRIG